MQTLAVPLQTDGIIPSSSAFLSLTFLISKMAAIIIPTRAVVRRPQVNTV